MPTKKKEVEQTKNAKQNLLKQGEAEKIKLEIQEKERQTLLANLQKKQKGIQNEIRKKKRSAEQLNAQIDRLIEIEIEKARKRAEEEARRKAAAEAAAKAAAAKKAENKTTGGVTRSKSTEKNEDTRKAAPVEKFSLNNEDRQLSGSFERNRGILPVPITGPYVIVSHYGQYAVDGLRNVKLDNKGIDIKGKPGAQARAVFDGEVSAIFQYNGLNNMKRMQLYNLKRNWSIQKKNIKCNIEIITILNRKNIVIKLSRQEKFDKVFELLCEILRYECLFDGRFFSLDKIEVDGKDVSMEVGKIMLSYYSGERSYTRLEQPMNDTIYKKGFFAWERYTKKTIYINQLFFYLGFCKDFTSDVRMALFSEIYEPLSEMLADENKIQLIRSNQDRKIHCRLCGGSFEEQKPSKN